RLVQLSFPTRRSSDLFSATYAFEEAHFIFFGESNNLERKDARRYIKMYGRKIYEFALNNVPDAMKTCLDKSGVGIDEVKKIFIQDRKSTRLNSSHVKI